LTDEQFNLIIQDIVNPETFNVGGGGADSGGRTGPLNGSNAMTDAMLGTIGGKRGLDDPSDGRGGKRSRFGVVE